MCCIVKCCNCHAHSIGCGYGWCGMAGTGLCACVCVCVCVEVGEMVKNIGMTIRKGNCGTIPTLFGCFFGIPSLYVLSFFVTCFCFFFLWGGERYEWCLDGLVVWGR